VDLDRDGDRDLVAIAQDIVWYDNLGGSPPSFVERYLMIFPPGTLNLYAGDLDRDLDIDLVGGYTAPDVILVYENLLPPPPIPALSVAGAGLFGLLAAAEGLRRIRRRRSRLEGSLGVTRTSEHRN